MDYSNKKLSRKERRRIQNGDSFEHRINFNLRDIKPLTLNQSRTYDYFNEGKNIMCHGMAGTGKTFISMYLSLKKVLIKSEYKKIVIIRSVVPTRDMGFLPGSNKDKSRVYEQPYHAIFTELFDRADAYEYLKGRNIVEFITTSFIRGITLNDSIVIADECQNMDWGELTSVITRVGKNCRIIFCGDFRQSDFRFREEKSRHDIVSFMKCLKTMKDDFALVEFDKQDIVRSNLVKNFIIAADNLDLSLS